MKPPVIIQKVLVFGLANVFRASLANVLRASLALALCASLVGAVQAKGAADPAATIQDMINAAPDGGTVNIPAGTYSETLLVDKNLTIKGNSYNDTTLQPAASDQRVIKVTAGHNLRLETLRVTGGHPTASNDDGGGGIYLAGGSLELDHVRIDHNQASYGGGVFQEGDTGSVTVTGSFFDTNTASVSGGGLYVKGSASLSGTLFSGNSAANHGGGIHVNGAATLTGGAFDGNHALNGNGGGLNVNDGLTVSSTVFSANTAAGTGSVTVGSGGAITQWNAGKTVTITGAVFTGNTAQVNGGAVNIHASLLTLTGSTFTSNIADSGASAGNTFGGGVYAGGGLNGGGLTFSANISKCTGCGSTAGGGMFITRPTGTSGVSTVTQSSFDGNISWLGSGIQSVSPDQLTLISCSFTNNGNLTAGQYKSGYGGGVSASQLHGDNLLFQNNQVMNFGGGVRANLSELTNSRFLGNQTYLSGKGGGIYAISTFNGTNLLFEGNVSGSGSAFSVETGSAVVYHVTIGQPARGAGSAIYVQTGATLELKNSIISAFDVGMRVDGTLNEDYNLVFNNGVDYSALGGGTIHFGIHDVALKDPLFANPAAHDYHLRWPSPAIGKGIDLGVATDLDGRPRLTRMDIGAYQFWSSMFLPMIVK